MRFATFNIRGWSSLKHAQITRMLRSHELTVLTETHVTSDHLPTNDYSRIHVADAHLVNSRIGGGVAIITASPFAFKLGHIISKRDYQIISGRFHDTTVIGCYLRPGQNTAIRRDFIFDLTRLCSGPVIILGDFNARHTLWDTALTAYGTMMKSFAARHQFKIHAPSTPTWRDHQSNGVLDLILTRRIFASKPVVLRTFTSLSDHLPISSEISFSRPSLLDYYIPDSLLQNSRIQSIARNRYREELPALQQRLSTLTSHQEFENVSRDIAERFVKPFADRISPRSSRFRGGWTKPMDRTRAQITRLLRDPNQRDLARRLDRNLKRELRRRRRRIQDSMIQELETAAPNEVLKIIKKLEISTNRTSTATPISMDRDAFSQLIQDQQNPASTCPQLTTFEVDLNFKEDLYCAIVTAKHNKSPGPDRIHSELLQIDPTLSTAVIFEIWRTVGRLQYLPKLLKTGFLAPIYKSGDLSIPSNYRPIALLSTIRRVISKALTIQASRQYSFSFHQFGFQPKSNTEIAVARVINDLPTFPKAASLDLQKAYDRVPRQILAKLVSERIPGLSAMVHALLSLSVFRTKGQISDTPVAIYTGVPQGDPFSPFLFNMFMDTYIEFTTTIPNSMGHPTCFADDVFLQARDEPALQSLLDKSTEWAEENGMTWNPQKSHLLGQMTQEINLTGSPLQSQSEIVYLGISLSESGTTDTQLLKRLKQAQISVKTLTTVLRHTAIDVRQRRSIIFSFLLSLFEYLLLLQPLTNEVRDRFHKIEDSYLRWCLEGVRIHTTLQRDKARLLLNLPSLDFRIQSQAYNLISKHVSLTRSPPSDDSPISLNHKQRFELCWDILKNHPAISDCIPLEDTRLNQAPWAWKQAQIEYLVNLQFTKVNQNISRKLPTHHRVHPLLVSDAFSRNARRTAILYYLNKLPVQNDSIRSQIHRVKPLLETEGWSRRLVRQLQNSLESLALERDLLCQSASLPQRYPNLAVSQPATSRRDP